MSSESVPDELERFCVQLEVEVETVLMTTKKISKAMNNATQRKKTFKKIAEKNLNSASFIPQSK